MKDIKGYEGIYKISEDGRVWSCYYKKFLSPFDNGHGYLYVALNKDYNRVKARIHRQQQKHMFPTQIIYHLLFTKMEIS